MEVTDGLRAWWAGRAGRAIRVVCVTALALCVLAVAWFLAVRFCVPAVMDSVSPAVFYRLNLGSVTQLVVVGIAALLFWFAPRKGIDTTKRKAPVGFKSGRRQQQALAAMMSIALVALAVILFGRYLDNQRLYAVAQEQFEVQRFGDVEEEGIRNTLTEMESELLRLRQSSGASNCLQRIQVEIYGPGSPVEKPAALPEWASGLVRIEKRTPIVTVPSALPEGFWTQTVFAYPVTLSHEIAHVVAFEILGPNRMSAIPVWYHEGFAQVESLSGFHRLSERARCRHYLWENRAVIPGYDELRIWSACSEGQLLLSYCCAFEWFRYLRAVGGEARTLEVFRQVALGLSFEEAFAGAFGTTSPESYDEWQEHFFG